MFGPKRKEKTLHDLYTSEGIHWNDEVTRKALNGNVSFMVEEENC